MLRNVANNKTVHRTEFISNNEMTVIYTDLSKDTMTRAQYNQLIKPVRSNS